MSTDEPFFRFNPTAYGENRSLNLSQEICEVCSKPSIWKYTGNIYAATSPTVCARCISGGQLKAFLNDDFFALHDIEIVGAAPELEQELLQRTPGVACFNPFRWPVLDGIPLAFIGYGDEKEVVASLDARTAITDEFKKFGLIYEPSPCALVFKEVDGSRYCAVVDPN